MDPRSAKSEKTRRRSFCVERVRRLLCRAACGMRWRARVFSRRLVLGRADETSFRGAFLNQYGKALLAAAEATQAAGEAPVRRRTLLSRLGLAKQPPARCNCGPT